MRHTTIRSLLAGAVLAAACVRPASAQNCTASGNPSSCSVTRTISITVRRSVSITVTPTSANLGNPTADDYMQGFTQALAHTLEIKANDTWNVLISSGRANFIATGRGSRGNKPRSDLQWATNAGGPYSAMTGTGVQMASGAATASTLVSLYYRVVWSWTLDVPGTYRLPIVLRITAP